MKKRARKSASKKRPVVHRNISTAKKKRAHAVAAEAVELTHGSKARDRASAKSGVGKPGVKGRASGETDGGADKQSGEFPDAVYLDR